MKRVLLITLIAAVVAVLIAPMTICAAATVSRTVPASVAPGAEFEVTINVSGYGDFGLVEETLPAGFTYLGLSEENAAILESVTPGSQEVKFYLLGSGLGSFTYLAQASDVKGPHTFTGMLTDDEPAESSIGDSTVYVGAVANRDMPSSVTTGKNFDVTVEVSGYGAIGLVEETLPTGFAFQSSGIEGVEVEQIGQKQTLRFALMGEDSFTYRVKASSATGAHPFEGVIKDIDKNEVPVGGDLSITVKSAGFPGGGGGYIPPTPTGTPAPTVAPTATAAPTPTVGPTYTPAPPTPTVAPTATPVVTPTATPTPTPTPEEEGGLAIWAWVLIALAIVAVIIGGVMFLRGRGGG